MWAMRFWEIAMPERLFICFVWIVAFLIFCTTFSPSQLKAEPERVAAAAQSCVSISSGGPSTTRISNSCEVRIYIGYCSTERAISGKLCGQRADAQNPFYTHLTTVEPGTTGTIGHPRHALRLAPCQGSPRNFTSGSDGNFSCTRAQAEQLAWAHGVARTAAEACERARSAAQPGELVNTACECEPLAQGAMVHCAQALSIPLEQVRAKKSFIDDLRKWLDQRSGSSPDSCAIVKCGGAIGARG
jgi:hypothetical protein